MKMINMTFMCAAALCGSFFSYLQADWIPEEVFDEQSVAPLNDERYLELKEQVFHHLQGSWCSAEKMHLLMDLTYLKKPKVCVEIGVFTGSTALPVLAVLKELNQGKGYLIDPWRKKEAIEGIPSSDPNYAWWSSLNMNTIRSSCGQMIEKFLLKNYCTIIPKTALEAIEQIPDEIDFLHLDGSFSEEQFFQNAKSYISKVKSKGYILISNIFLSIDGHYPRMKALWHLYDHCDYISDVDGNNAILFQKP